MSHKNYRAIVSRLLLIVLAAVLCATVIVGCGAKEEATPAPAPTPSPAPAPAPTPAPAPQPEEKKVLVLAATGDAGTLDTVRTMSRARELIINIYDWCLLDFEETTRDGVAFLDGTKPAPRVITEWSTEKLPDGRVVNRMKIRDDIVFHSGNRLTAEDVAWSLIRRTPLKMDYVNVTNAGFGGPNVEEQFKVIDDYTLEVYTDKVYPLFWHVMGQRTYYDSKWVKENAAPDDPWGINLLQKELSASGPYTVKLWVPGVEMILERFEDYWGERPYFDEIVMRVIPDASSRALMLRAGLVDIAYGIPLREIKAMQDEPGIKIIAAPSPREVRINMNTQVAPFDNVLVRQAFAYAFPYDDAIAGAYMGMADRVNGFMPNVYPGAWDTPYFNTDLNKAKELLQEAGYGSGLDVTFVFSEQLPEHEVIAVLFKENLAKIGVNMEIRQLTTGEFSSQKRERTMVFGIDDGISFIWDVGYEFHIKYESIAATNVSNYNNPVADDYVQKIMFSTGDERMGYIEEMQQLLAQEVPIIPVAHPRYVMAMRDDIGGWVFSPTEYTYLWRLYRE